jgi:5'-nucleotidase
VAANTIDRGTGGPVLPPYEVVERDGVRIGFIGVTTLETPDIIIPDAAEDFRFPDISQTVNRHAAKLRARGVETIVVLAHSGALDTSRGGTTNEIVTETKQMSDSVDVVISGHTHNRLDLRVAGKLVVQAEKYGTALGVVDLKVDRADGDVTGSKARVVTTYDDRVRPDPEVAALVERYRERVAPISNRVLGAAAETITPASTEAGESALGDFVADGQRDLAGADFALVPTGGLRTDISRGPATYGELFSVQPSGRDLVEMELEGEQVRRALEQQYGPDRDHLLAVSGLRYSYDPSRPPGSRVTAVTLPNGEALSPTKKYSVAVNGFLAAGGGDFEVFTKGEDRRTVGTDIEALVEHAKNLPQPFEAPDPAREPRVTVKR